MKTCEEYVLNELEAIKKENEKLKTKIQELEDLKKYEYLFTKLVALTDLEVKDLGGNLKGIHGCSFNLYNDDNKEMFEALEKYAKYEEQ